MTTETGKIGEEAVQAGAGPLAGKYLSFQLGDDTYGAPIAKAREIIGAQPITRVPRVPAFIRGVINLRGMVIPVVDLRAKFGMPPRGKNSAFCVIVAQTVHRRQTVPIGLIVDSVSEVLNFAENEVETATAEGLTTLRADYLLGVGKSRRRIYLLLNIDVLLSERELTNTRQEGL